MRYLPVADSPRFLAPAGSRLSGAVRRACDGAGAIVLHDFVRLERRDDLRPFGFDGVVVA